MERKQAIRGVMAALACMITLADVAAAEDRVTLGWGRLFHNDAIGDGQDRWQSGGYTVSMVRGYSFSGDLPARPGEILEFRLSGDIAAPANLQSPAADDRRYAGSLSLGVHTHFQWKGAEVSLGGDLVATGEQTGIGSFHSWAHDKLGAESPDPALENQIGNGFHPTLVAEIGRGFALGGAEARPFVELRAGAETMVRMGADVTFGGFGPGDLMLRDRTTGLRYRGVAGDVQTGMTFTLGADVARVFDSVYFPSDGAVTLSPDRMRLRAGVQWQGEHNSIFYGLSYLSPEFEEQSEGQVVGGLSLNLRF